MSSDSLFCAENVHVAIVLAEHYIPFFSWLYFATWHDRLFYRWKRRRNFMLFPWRQWSFQLDFPCQNYSVITVYVRFPIRIGQERHITEERSDSNLTHLFLWSVKLGSRFKKCWLPQQNNQAEDTKDKRDGKYIQSNTLPPNQWGSEKNKGAALALA